MTNIWWANHSKLYINCHSYYHTNITKTSISSKPQVTNYWPTHTVKACYVQREKSKMNPFLSQSQHLFPLPSHPSYSRRQFPLPSLPSNSTSKILENLTGFSKYLSNSASHLDSMKSSSWSNVESSSAYPLAIRFRNHGLIVRKNGLCCRSLRHTDKTVSRRCSTPKNHCRCNTFQKKK